MAVDAAQVRLHAPCPRSRGPRASPCQGARVGRRHGPGRPHGAHARVGGANGAQERRRGGVHPPLPHLPLHRATPLLALRGYPRLGVHMRVERYRDACHPGAARSVAYVRPPPRRPGGGSARPGLGDHSRGLRARRGRRGWLDPPSPALTACLEYMGTSLIRKRPPSQDPTVALCLGPYGYPRGWAVSYERGTPVAPLLRRGCQVSAGSMPRRGGHTCLSSGE